jgi:hypothetical protein
MSRRALAAGLVALSLGRAAGAQTVDPEAEHQRGIALRNEHRDAEALEVFRGLYERTGEVRALARMALAEAALSRWVEAEAHLQRALATPDAWVAQNRASLDAGLATVRQHVGGLTVHANVPGAEVFLAGQRAAVVPFERPLRVAAGTVDVEIRAPQHATAHRTVTVRPGVDVTALDVELAPAEPGAAPTVAPPPQPPPPTAAPVDPPAPEYDPEARRAREARRATWESVATAGFVLGGAGLLASAISLGVREGAVSSFNNSNRCELVSEDPLAFTATGRDCSALYHRGEAATLVSVTGLAAGAVFAAGGAVAWFVSTRSTPLHAFACAPSLNEAGVTCAGRF